MTRKIPILVIAFVCLCLRISAQEALVRIYSTSNGETSKGTGFFSSNQGQIITAYHVVEGASGIEVYSEQLGKMPNIRVEYISPTHDIAVLQVLNSGVTPSLALSDYAPRTEDDLQIQGYPLGDPYQVLRAYSTRTGLVSTRAYNNTSGQRLFALDIEIIPLGSIVFSGMSGGPVLHSGKVIGILSGSYVEGGSIAWAIPMKYVNTSLKKVMLKPSQISRWEPLQLMNMTNWHSLRGLVRVNTSAAAMSREYSNRVEALAQTYHQLYEQAQKTFQVIQGYRPFLERVATDTSLDSETAADLLNRARDPIADTLLEFSKLSEKAGNDGHDLGEVQMQLFAWIADQGNVDEKSGRALVKKGRSIVNSHSEMMHGLDTYLNLDGRQISKAAPELAVALSRSRGPSEDAKALLVYLDTFGEVVEAYASPKSLLFMSSVIGLERQIGQLMEPIVYQSQVSQEP